MTNREFRRLVKDIVEVARQEAPYESGTLSGAINFEFLDKKTARIYVDEAIAPYMPYTNEPWVSSWWRGKQNPNLYWWDKMAQIAKAMIGAAVGADATRSVYNFGAVDILKMEREYQNKTGDYTAYDAYYHSSYLSETHIPISQWVDAVRGKYGGIE